MRGDTVYKSLGENRHFRVGTPNFYAVQSLASVRTMDLSSLFRDLIILGSPKELRKKMGRIMEK